MNTTITHTPRSFAYTPATCTLCGRQIRQTYYAVNNTTGQVEPFGTNCHYQVTGVDTRMATDRADRRPLTEAEKAEAARRKWERDNPVHGPHQVESTEIEALFNTDGEFITANWRHTKFGGAYYRASTDQWFNVSSAQKEERRVNNNAKNGLFEGTVRVECWDSGKVRTDDNFNPIVIAVVDNGQPTPFYREAS